MGIADRQYMARGLDGKYIDPVPTRRVDPDEAMRQARQPVHQEQEHTVATKFVQRSIWVLILRELGTATLALGAGLLCLLAAKGIMGILRLPFHPGLAAYWLMLGGVAILVFQIAKFRGGRLDLPIRFVAGLGLAFALAFAWLKLSLVGIALF